jgi:glucokinase
MPQYAIAVDLGGTFIKFGVADSHGNLLFKGKIPALADVSAHAVLEQIVKAVCSCKAFAAEQHLPLTGVGIGSPGITDPTLRIVKGGADNIRDWVDIPLAEQVEQAVSLPVIVNNDANLMGLGEASFGAAKGCSDVLFITVGTGIGGAVIIGGQPFGGYRNCGGEIGHIVLFAGGEPCSCGSSGCLEQYASASALVRRFTSRFTSVHGAPPREAVDGEWIVKRYLEGDSLAVGCIDEHCFFLGRGIAGLINIFSPQKVVVGGGISEAGSFYIDKIRENALKYAMPDCAGHTDVVASSLGNDAGCLGAARLVFQHFCL